MFSEGRWKWQRQHAVTVQKQRRQTDCCKSRRSNGKRSTLRIGDSNVSVTIRLVQTLQCEAATSSGPFVIGSKQMQHYYRANMHDATLTLDATRKKEGSITPHPRHVCLRQYSIHIFVHSWCMVYVTVSPLMSTNATYNSTIPRR